MPYPGLEQYLARLAGNAGVNTQLWLDGEGRAQGRYFNTTLTSAFQSIHDAGSDRIVGFEAYARSYSDTDQGLSLWKLLDHAASDDESIELDRLCRMLHAINFFRQQASGGADLYLGVHARLLAAVDANHGTAFKRVLSVLDLPKERVVLQLPAFSSQQGWLVKYVADNYRRNGFRVAVNAASLEDAHGLIDRVRPEAIKLDMRQISDAQAAARLLERCGGAGVRLMFKRVESRDALRLVRHIAEQGAGEVLAQGFFWGVPHAGLTPAAWRVTTLAPVEKAVASSARL
jgi:EAL domain-containing protein (putative c-di-GMP-specific phosphodiesterase class I)